MSKFKSKATPSSQTPWKEPDPVLNVLRLWWPVFIIAHKFKLEMKESVGGLVVLVGKIQVLYWWIDLESWVLVLWLTIWLVKIYLGIGKGAKRDFLGGWRFPSARPFSEAQNWNLQNSYQRLLPILKKSIEKKMLRDKCLGTDGVKTSKRRFFKNLKFFCD